MTACYLLASRTIDEQMASVQRKRAVTDAVTDGHRLDTSALDAVVQALRERPAGFALRAAA